jgi:hypothetical protein
MSMPVIGFLNSASLDTFPHFVRAFLRMPEVVRGCLAAPGSQLLGLKEQILDFDRMINSASGSLWRGGHSNRDFRVMPDSVL